MSACTTKRMSACPLPSEGVRRRDRVEPAGEEIVLDARALVVLETGVIAAGASPLASRCAPPFVDAAAVAA